MEKSMNTLLKLINHQAFHDDCKLLKCMQWKISTRLRNSHYSRSIVQLNRMIRIFNKKIKHFNRDKSIKNNLSKIFLEKFANCLHKICMISLKLFRLSKIWIELEQLVNHFLIINGLASRICIFSKAFMVYTYDIYLQFVKNQNDDKLIKLLKQMKIKPLRRVQEKIVPKSKIKDDKDLGVPIDRNIFNTGKNNSKSNKIDGKLKKKLKKTNDMVKQSIDNVISTKKSLKISKKKKRLLMANKFTVINQ